VTRILKSIWTWITLWATGLCLLGGYLALTGDWRISVPWALAYVAISVAVAWLFVGLKLYERFPKLDRHLLYPHDDKAGGGELTSDQWALAYARYIDAGFRSKAALLTPGEDGLICVPVLLVGIGFVPAFVGGIVFGVLHLGRFTYLDCIGKGIIYALVCYFVLPHGLLTVVLGHLLMNGIAFFGLQVAKHKLGAKLRSNHTVETDARETGARGSP
jgi:hypothetical protein